MDIYGLVKQFQVKILGNLPYNKIPDETEYKFIIDTLQEELDEFKEAYDKKDYTEMGDALIDLIYFALGHSYRMGFDFDHFFNQVHKANMKKVVAKTKRGQVDALKPDDWLAPVFDEIVMPKLFIEAARVQMIKDKDYNNKHDRKDYFPFGLKSYIQMLWIKVMRMVNVVDQNKVFNEPLHDSVIDLVNYASFLYDEIAEEE